ncbi:hypothetical protein [Bacillus sp. Cs-700]|uniref:hypothetical protein n=1 Tax=Bacillus sp. Cs-700 TaxID=2589818 RepID=UPI00140DC956|nr:hypothetical protein [Bacillus sp. Cs-700]
MHTKHTVRYICERYSSGNCYYYKQELITHDSWQNPTSINWSTKRPISSRTFFAKEREGYKTVNILHHKKPAEVLPFSRT